VNVVARARAGGAERESALAFAAALVAVSLWASAFVAIRSADRGLSPGAVALGRMLVGSLVLGVVVRVRREPFPPRRVLPGIVFSGVLWFAAYMVLLNEAERRVDAGTASMLVNLGPILIALLAGVFLREGFAQRLLLGCAVAFAGAAVIAVATSGRSTSAGWGAALCVAAAFAYAGGVVAQKPLLRHASPLQVVWLSCTVGAIACLPFAPQLGHALTHSSASSLGWTAYLGVAPTAIGFMAWAFALARTSAGRLGATTYLVPPIAIVLSWSLLGEAPTLLAVLGGAVCVAGVVLARRG
jgi:drug/metabolite transporter (DMT)-like permease